MSMRLHPESFDPDRKIIFEKLVKFRNFGYLAGGTALALQIGHRVSYDFDIFCGKEIGNTIICKAKKEFSIKETLINSKEEFTFVDKAGVKISFIYYPFDLNNFVVKTPNNIGILSIKGVALAKSYALNRRASWRDYIDLYFVLKNKKASLKGIIKKSEKVYGEIFAEKLFLTQLVYTKDIDKREVAETKFLKEKVTLREVEKYFQREVDKYLSLKRDKNACKKI